MVKLFREDIALKVSSVDNCPSKFAYDWQKNDGLITDVSFSDIPECTASDDLSGCCRSTQECGKNKDLGLSILNGDISYNICHTEKIASENQIVDFFKLIFFAIIVIMITAIFGCIYEFWLSYGNAIDCFYYKSKFNNISKDGAIASLNDYMFPSSICYYPYQYGNNNSQYGGKKQSGGAEKIGFNSNYNEYKNAGVKCISAYDNEFKDYSDHKVFPYNLADYVEKNYENELLKMPVKVFSFTFLYIVLLTRFVINYVMNKLSEKYNTKVKKNAIMCNILFLFLTGLIFPVLNMFFNIGSYMNVGPGFYLAGILSIISLLIYIFSAFAIILLIFPSYFLKSQLDKCNISTNYYKIFNSNPFYPAIFAKDEILSKGIRFRNFLYNILIGFVYMIIIMFSFISCIISQVFVTIYMNFSIIYNFFAIPLSNYVELMDILKSHSNMLTILFCISIIGSSYFSNFSPTTTGIMGGILAILIAYKLSNKLYRKV